MSRSKRRLRGGYATVALLCGWLVVPSYRWFWYRAV